MFRLLSLFLCITTLSLIAGKVKAQVPKDGNQSPSEQFEAILNNNSALCQDLTAIPPRFVPCPEPICPALSGKYLCTDNEGEEVLEFSISHRVFYPVDESDRLRFQGRKPWLYNYEDELWIYKGIQQGAPFEYIVDREHHSIGWGVYYIAGCNNLGNDGKRLRVATVEERGLTSDVFDFTLSSEGLSYTMSKATWGEYQPMEDKTIDNIKELTFGPKIDCKPIP